MRGSRLLVSTSPNLLRKALTQSPQALTVAYWPSPTPVADSRSRLPWPSPVAVAVAVAVAEPEPEAAPVAAFEKWDRSRRERAHVAPTPSVPSRTSRRRHAVCAERGMTAPTSRNPLPHHSLQVFQVARELLLAVRDAQIRDAKLRDEATRAAKGVCLNIAEGAARITRADKARAYAIARGEAAEVGAAIEIAVLVSAASAEDEAKIVSLASRVVAMLTRLIR